MSDAVDRIALCSAVGMDCRPGSAPEWVHLLPQGVIRTADGRGPYLVESMARIASLLTGGGMLPIDENHATDKGGAKGMPAPARGWIVALQARASGLWGKVQWTGERRKLVEDKAYIGISPVILHTAAGKIIQVLRASLTNTPNLQGLTSLHSYAAPTALASKLPHVLDTAYRRIMQLLGQSEGQYLRGLPDR